MEAEFKHKYRLLPSLYRRHAYLYVWPLILPDTAVLYILEYIGT